MAKAQRRTAFSKLPHLGETLNTAWLKLANDTQLTLRIQSVFIYDLMVPSAAPRIAHGISRMRIPEASTIRSRQVGTSTKIEPSYAFGWRTLQRMVTLLAEFDWSDWPWLYDTC